MKYNILVIEGNNHTFRSRIVAVLTREGFDVVKGSSEPADGIHC